MLNEDVFYPTIFPRKPMKSIQKHIIAISALVTLTLGALYLIVSQTHTSKSDGVKLATISQSGIETDTIKRLETVANSGTQWGMSPFGSGKPLTEETVPKIKFQKPNREWKTRTLNINGKWITYEFGKGQPEGAKPLSEEEKEAYKKCYYNTVVHDIDCPPSSRMGVREGYLTADIERELLSLITDPNWEKVLTNCEQQFRKYEDISSTSDTTSHGFVTYETMLNGKALDPENLIGIDESTGRKHLVLPMQEWLRRPLLAGASGDFVNIHILDNCITQNGGRELARKMDTLYQKQFYPDWNYPARITDKTQYVPLY